jgi:hypothetical protein
MTKRIAFYSNQLGERGTEIALYDYAYYNETLLNNKSIIIYNKNHPWNNEHAIKKFKNKFEVFGISSDANAAEIDNILFLEKCDIIYMILYGTPIQVPIEAKVCIHCVFFCMDKPFGHVYSSIAPWVKNNNNRYPVVPHMINLPDNNDDMREELGIPSSAVVYARYGGLDEFNIEYVHKTIYKVAKNDPNIFFLFANTNKFCDDLPNIIHIGTIIDLDEKVRFINTSDAMIWARNAGETFSCSMGEFSIRNKPILCTRVGILGHVALLKENALWYDENNLEEILTGFDKEANAKHDWNMYKDYMPEPVMQTFKQVFIDSVPNNLHPINFSIPECKISPTIPMKVKLLSSIIPGDRSAYNFKTETDYYTEYRISMFAKTCKKSGWDCMRHYEIIANGCIPYFTDLELCPKDTMTLLPKDLLRQGNALYERMRISYTDNDLYEYIELNRKLMICLKMNLTTRKMANYILEKSNKTNVSNILFLSGSTLPDYLRCLSLHGFKELFGARCHDYPKVAHMYKNQNIDYTRLYGMGMSYSNILEPEMNNSELDATIQEDIRAKKYDLVIYGSYHRGLPYYDLVSKIYRGDEIIMLCGEDIHECKAKDYILSKGHHLFVREL